MMTAGEAEQREEKMKALSKLGATIRNSIFKRIENEKKTAEECRQATT